MRPKRFVHVGFGFGNNVAPIDALKKTFNAAADWVRYSNSCWILYTSKDLDTWRDRIRNTPGITDDISFLLVEFDKDSTSGYMREWIWDWLAKDRTANATTGQLPQKSTHDLSGRRP